MGRALLAAQQQHDLDRERPFMQAKIATAQFYAEHILTKAPSLREAIFHGGHSVMALPEEAF